MLKFAETANVGDVIKAYDFQPMEGRPECYLIGKVISKGRCYQEIEGSRYYLCDGYDVEIIDSDLDSLERVGTKAIVPFEVDFLEWDGRVAVVATAEEMSDIAEEFGV